MKWIKASERLPVGTAVAKNNRLRLIGEMSVYDDHVSYSAYPSYHVFLEFKNSELYDDYEWLDEDEQRTPDAVEFAEWER